MRFADYVRFSGGAIRGHRVRTVLTLGGIAVGVAAVVLLTGLGEGARRYVMAQFQTIGSNVVAVIPGKVETSGAAPIIGASERDLTLDDARAVAQRCPRVRRVSPVSLGSATMEFAGRGRNVTVVGATPEYFELRELGIAAGTPLPPIDPHQVMRVVVVGRTVQRELFRGENPLGRLVRLGEWRFRVIGVLERKGMAMGMDIDNIVIVPVGTAMRLFNRTGLFRIVMQSNTWADNQKAIDEVKAVLRERHDDDEDFTVVTQGSVVSALDSIMQALTMGLIAIAAISLSVAGIGVMNVMLVSVAERTGEIGLMKAVGATHLQVMGVFLAEAVQLSMLGGLLGTAMGYGGAIVLEAVIGNFNAMPPVWAVGAALGVAALVGATFGLLPARRASRVDPVVALSKGKA